MVEPQIRATLKKTKRAFTLLEVAVAMVLLTIAAAVVGFKMHGAVKKKQLRSEVERLRSRLFVTQRLSLAMETDWRGSLQRDAKGWVFDAVCEEGVGRKSAPLRMGAVEVFLDGQRVDRIEFEFFSTGKMSPEGPIVFLFDGERVEWSKEGGR